MKSNQSGVLGLRHICFFVAALILAGCVQPQPPGQKGGYYKVGTPYKIDGVWYYPKEDPDYDFTGIASWYGHDFHGKLTANGETYDMYSLTAAHPTWPMPTKVRVTNLENGRSLELRVNDRGPFRKGRIIDVSKKASQLLGFHEQGTAKVRVTFLGRAYVESEIVEKPRTSRAERTAAKAAPVAQVAKAQLPVIPGVKVAEATTPVGPVEAPAAASPAAAGADGDLKVVPVSGSTDLYVQAGAFLAPSNAKKLAGKLEAVGPPVRVNRKDLDGRNYYQVRLGPLPDLDEADETLEQVVALGHNDARIIVD